MAVSVRAGGVEMRGRPLHIDWQDDEAALRRRHRQERDPELRPRWHALWLVRGGLSLRAAARVLGVDERSVRRWVAWYRAGGTTAVAEHRRGGRAGQPAWLTPAQQAALRAEAGRGAFRTAGEAAQWVRARFGVAYTASGMRAVLHRLGCRPKVPRPLAEQADPAAQAAWKKGGLAAALVDAGVKRGEPWAHADEMRLGLHGQVRRVWAPRGVKVRQRRQIACRWACLALAVDGQRGTLRWAWLPTVRKEALAPVVAGWQAASLTAVVWDRAGGHRARLVREVGLPLVALPADAPECNPAERVFEELRRATEGRVFADVAAKQAVAEAVLATLAADPDRVRRLAGWDWVAAAEARLPLRQ